jgi:hypothetical protein
LPGGFLRRASARDELLGLCLDERLSRLCAPVMATDLRALVSLVIAALAAEGELGRRT